MFNQTRFNAYQSPSTINTAWSVLDEDSGVALYSGYFNKDGYQSHALKVIQVKHWFTDDGLCRRYYKDVITGFKYALTIGFPENEWYSVTGDLLEPDCPIYAMIIDEDGKELTSFIS